jgi:hypothetical protein
MKEIFRRACILYFFLLLTNVGIFGYEVWIVGMTCQQSLLARIVTLFTGVLEAVVVAYLSFRHPGLLEAITKKISFQLACKTWGWVESGFRMALIWPTVYIIKLLLLDSFLYRGDIGIDPIGMEKIIFAYVISLVTSFCLGVAFFLFLERWINNVLCSIQASWARLLGRVVTHKNTSIN